MSRDIDLYHLVMGHSLRLWRQRRLRVWIVPHGSDYEVHWGGSYWTTAGLKPRSAERGGNLAWAIERARERLADCDRQDRERARRKAMA
jgi:hypothetical protein